MPPLPRVTALELIRALESVGWERMTQSGSHAKFRHPNRPGRVIVAIHGSRTIPLGTLRTILRQAGLTPDELRVAVRERRFIIILTPEPDGSAYNVTVPALPGCVTWGTTVEEAIEMARDAIAVYLEGEDIDELVAGEPSESIVATVTI